VDTAQKTSQLNDFSAGTVWRVYQNRYFLADVWRDRLEFPDLKRRVVQSYRDAGAHLMLVEDTGSGTALIQSLADEPLLNIVPFQSKLEKAVRDRGRRRRQEGPVHVLAAQ
jgi:phage terminase large subunit-like protein